MKLKPNIQQSLRIHITGGSLGGDFVIPPGYYILGRLGDKELAKTLSKCFFVSRAHCVLAVGEEPMPTLMRKWHPNPLRGPPFCIQGPTI